MVSVVCNTTVPCVYKDLNTENLGTVSIWLAWDGYKSNKRMQLYVILCPRNSFKLSINNITF